jgi:hypothetical protein
LNIVGGVLDPFGGTLAFTVTNTSQIAQELTQRLVVPADYQYCFSIYVLSAQIAPVILGRRGLSTAATASYSAGPAWTRLVSSGRLTDSSDQLSVVISLAAGQQVSLYGPQLEAQTAPARYRSTTNSGAVYSNAHWGVEELSMTAEAPDLLSVSFSIEAMLQG